MDQGSGVAVSCGVSHGWGPELWCRSAATVPIQHLAWEPPYAVSAALKRKKNALLKLRGGVWVF